MSTTTRATTWFGSYGLPGFLGSSFIAIGSFGVGWFPLAFNPLRWPLLNFLQTQTAGLALSRALVVVGAALILQAWLVIGIDTLHDKLISEQTMFKILLTWISPLIFAAPLFSRDVYSYFMQGHLQLQGDNPYVSGVAVVPGWFNSGVDPMWADSKTPYGPLFLFVERVIAQACGPHVYLASYVFRLIGVLSVLLLARSVAALARRHGIDGASAMWLATLNPLVLMHFIAGSHNDSLMIALVTTGLVLAIDQRFILAICITTLGLAVKPVAIVVLPFIAIIHTSGRPIRERLKAFGVTGFISALTMVILSLIAHVSPLGWLSALQTPGAVRSWLSPMTALGILTGAPTSHLGMGDQMGHAISIFRAIGFAITVIVLMVLTVKPQGRSGARGAAYAIGALVVFGPVVQPWYLLWTIPLLAATGLSKIQLRITIIAIFAFTVHGISNSSATADTFFEFSDGLAMVLATLILCMAVAASPRERALIFGDAETKPLLPLDQHNQLIAESRVIV